MATKAQHLLWNCDGEYVIYRGSSRLLSIFELGVHNGKLNWHPIQKKLLNFLKVEKKELLIYKTSF